MVHHRVVVMACVQHHAEQNMSGSRQVVGDVAVSLSGTGCNWLYSLKMGFEFSNKVRGIRQGVGGGRVEKFTREAESCAIYHVCSDSRDVLLEGGPDA